MPVTAPWEDGVCLDDQQTSATATAASTRRWQLRNGWKASCCQGVTHSVFPRCPITSICGSSTRISPFIDGISCSGVWRASSGPPKMSYNPHLWILNSHITHYWHDFLLHGVRASGALSRPSWPWAKAGPFGCVLAGDSCAPGAVFHALPNCQLILQGQATWMSARASSACGTPVAPRPNNSRVEEMLLTPYPEIHA